MSKWQHIANSAPGINSWVGVEGDDVITIEQQSSKSNDAILDYTRAARNSGIEGKEEFRELAQIPTTLYWCWQGEWKTKFADDMTLEEYIAIQLNRPEYAYLRCIDGRVETRRTLMQRGQVARFSKA